MKLTIEEKESIKPKFKKTGLYNEEILDYVMGMEKTTVFTLEKQGEVLAEIPTIVNSIGEYEFAGYFYCPYVDTDWLCKDVADLILLYEMAKEKKKLIDIVDVLDREGLEEFEEDYGSSLVLVTDSETRRKHYSSKSFRKRIRQLRNKAEGKLTYLPIDLRMGDRILKDWFDSFENKFFTHIRTMYEIWYNRNELLVFGIFYNEELVGVDYILLHEGLASGLLTPWKKDKEELQELQIGYYAIDKALDELHKLKVKHFDIGERSMEYKRRWETEILKTRVIGLGRWENREE